MTTDTGPEPLLHDESRPLDPLGDLDIERERAKKYNRAKVGSGRPSSLLYTYGPGSIMDLPQFTIMPAGLDDWDRIWARRDSETPTIHAPRLRAVVRTLLGSTTAELRPFPWQPKSTSRSNEGNDLGVPSRVFPQWLRCTGCDMLAPLSRFSYHNTHPYRTDEAGFEHERCPGRGGSKPHSQPAVPARYLLACTNGHLDEFPYDRWVHRGLPCPNAENPSLRMPEHTSGRGASASIECASCGGRRSMTEAQGEAGRLKLPRCRGRYPHLDAFADGGCGNETWLMLVGASNLWFGASQSIIVMPASTEEKETDLLDQIRQQAREDQRLATRLHELRDDSDRLRLVLEGRFDIDHHTDDELRDLVARLDEREPTWQEQREQARSFDPVDLLVPEWTYLQTDPLGDRHEDPDSGLVLSRRQRDPALRPEISRVLAVDRLRKVNALVGFTRIDDFDRVGDDLSRLVPLTRKQRPDWTIATENLGEGIFLQLDEASVTDWERRVLGSGLWRAHRQAHRRNFERRFSETAANVNPDSRFRPPRYWLIHTFAHVLIRQMAMSCGYSAASLSERLYAWPPADGRAPAAGLLICTTASDSDGTLGGLVRLSDPDRLQHLVGDALYRATRCSSDPICALREPKDPEDFLHGAACHCCVMASETSCERANRFLDRKLLINLPGSNLGFFGTIDQ